jgi:hypothetical protein
MFNMTLGSTGYEWRCTFTGCTAAGQGTNAAETAQDAVRHRDREHPEMVWSIPRQNAVQDVLLWLQDQEGSENLKVAPASVMKLVNTIARTLGLPQADTPLPTIAEVANWGKDPLTMENMGDIRLIEAPRSTGPTRNWTTNHQVRWSVGELIQHPPEGSGCQARGARVGENVELCALPKHNPANVKHVFAIGERVTRIAHN